MQDITPTLTTSIDTIMSKKERELEKAGAGRQATYEAYARGLRARKSIALKDGSVIEEDDIPTQVRTAEIVSGLNGDKKPDMLVDNRSVTITIGDNADEVRAILEMGKDIKRQLEELPRSGRQTGEIIDVTVAG